MHAALRQHCAGLTSKIQALRKAKAGLATSQEAVSAFRMLQALERPARQAAVARQESSKALLVRVASGDWDAGEEHAELQEAASEIRSCLLVALREARLLALALPSDVHVRAALQCDPVMLQAVEELSVSEGEAAADAGTRFSLGLYFSELGISGHFSPFFSNRRDPPWARDAKGLNVPEDIARAETLLLQAVDASLPTDRDERAATRALRLYQHAKSLALAHHDAAAEWRYKASARLAHDCQRPRLAAHSLARLGYFLKLRGRHGEALIWASRALEYGKDPLAVFLQATLRRSLGHLRTSEEVKAAEEALDQIGGRLPSKALETERQEAATELALWRAAAEGGGLRACMDLFDAARILICILCRVPFR